MAGFDPFLVDVYPSEDEPLYAVPVREWSQDQGREAVEVQYPSGLPVRYLGVRVVHLSPDDEHRGRRRRAHIFTDEPA